MDKSLENNVLVIQTIQIAPFRTLMTALKDILLETNIIFQNDGIKIINMDKSHTILVHLFLAAQNFEVYNCGYNEANYSVAELAHAVADGDLERVAINKNAEPDKRSYKVNFSKFENVSGFSSPLKPLGTSISELKGQLNEIKKRHCDEEEVSRRFKRHETLKKLIRQNLINEELEWRK